VPDNRQAVKFGGIPPLGLVSALVIKTANYTLGVNDSIVLGNASGGAFTFTLPSAAAAGAAGRVYTLKKTDSSLHTVTIATTSAQTIDGATSITLTRQWQYIQVASDGTNWQILDSVLLIDTTAADIQALGTQAAGASGLTADAEHVHPMPTLDQLGAPAGNVAMNGHKITGAANGTASTDLATVGQLPAVPAFDTTAADLRASGAVASAGSTGLIADAGHRHPLNSNSISGPLAQITTTDTLIVNLPVDPANVIAGSMFHAVIHGTWTNTATQTTNTFTMHADNLPRGARRLDSEPQVQEYAGAGD
jgi:hypothetical protein